MTRRSTVGRRKAAGGARVVARMEIATRLGQGLARPTTRLDQAPRGGRESQPNALRHHVRQKLFVVGEGGKQLRVQSLGLREQTEGQGEAARMRHARHEPGVAGQGEGLAVLGLLALYASQLLLDVFALLREHVLCSLRILHGGEKTGLRGAVVLIVRIDVSRLPPGVPTVLVFGFVLVCGECTAREHELDRAVVEHSRARLPPQGLVRPRHAQDQGHVGVGPNERTLQHAERVLQVAGLLERAGDLQLERLVVRQIRCARKGLRGHGHVFSLQEGRPEIQVHLRRHEFSLPQQATAPPKAGDRAVIWRAPKAPASSTAATGEVHELAQDACPLLTRRRQSLRKGSLLHRVIVEFLTQVRDQLVQVGLARARGEPLKQATARPPEHRRRCFHVEQPIDRHGVEVILLGDAHKVLEHANRTIALLRLLEDVGEEQVGLDAVWMAHDATAVRIEGLVIEAAEGQHTRFKLVGVRLSLQGLDALQRCARLLRASALQGAHGELA